MRVLKSLSFLSAWFVTIAVLAGYAGGAAAQQPEKRIALVVGNGAYAKAPLATAANDAGLIAQTLQAAGFDVIGARDLDGDTLRKSFRDFIQKAEASGPDTVAMVYLAGYGLQLAGDNYFVPVDSAINRETDVPIEALRTGDYIRQLAGLPLKAGIVVLDAARQQPFVSGQIASGFALVEADPHMLIAFNAAPGTVAPAEQGPYGIYAQSLAEMIRTGGLPLPEVFNRLRLRVNEASKGAQVPWDSQKVDAGFTFFERAPDAPPPAAPDQSAALRDKPIRDLGVQDAYAAALERDTLPAYEEFLSAYAGDPLAKRVRAIAAARREAITWRRTYRTDTPNAYWSYLQRYPRGPHAADARRRLSILTASLEPPPTFDVIDYDVPPPPPEEIVYIDRPVLAFGDPEFDFVAPPPAPVYYLPPPPDDFIVLEPPPPPVGLFILPQPYFVPIPVYYRPPRYIAPPPNNIIFANIHNRAVIDGVINRRGPPGPGGGPGGNGMGRPGVPVAPGGIAGRGPAAAVPGLPPAVAQRATLIQQGRAPVPPSASINPAVRTGLPGAPGAGPAGRPNGLQPPNAPAALPPGQPMPRNNALPVPGARGAPGAPPSAAVNPNVRTAPGGLPPSATPAGRPAVGATAPAGLPPRGGPPPGAAAPGRPAAAIAPGPRPELRREPPPSAVNVARPSPPPGRVAPSPPPARMAPPPARMAAPSPPPRMAAPPPRMAAPPPRMAAPPPRMAAPAPPPRMAAPPPRMAAPPPRAAPPAAARPAARSCPPGARC